MTNKPIRVLLACGIVLSAAIHAQTWTVTPSPGGIDLHQNQSGLQDQTNLTYTTYRDGIVYTWRDARGSSQDIYAQKMNPCGAKVWSAAGVAVCNAAQNQQEPQIIADAAGGAIICWMDTRGADWDIYAQHIDNNGTPTWTANGVGVCTNTGDQQHPVMCTDGAGGAIIAWEDTRNGNRDIFVQHLNSSGTATWLAGGYGVCTLSQTQQDICIVTDSAGGAVLAWEDSRPLSSGQDIYGERMNSAGNPVWGPAGSGIALCILSTAQADPAVANTGSNSVMFTWADPNGAGQNIKAIKINTLTGAVMPGWTTNGTMVGIAITQSGNPGTSLRPKIAADLNGGAYIAFRSTYSSSDKDVLTVHVDANGTTLNCPSCWNYMGYYMETTAYSIWVEDYQDITPDGCGGAVVTWDIRNNGTNYVQYRQFGYPPSVNAATGGGTGDCDNPKITAVNSVYYLDWEDSRTGTLGSDDVYAGATSSLAPPAVLNLTGTTNYTIANGCISTNSVTVCQGSSLTFTCAGPSGLFNIFTFKDGATTVQSGSSTSFTTSSLTAGTHTITVTASTASGCSTNSSNSFVITVTPGATLSVSGVTNVSCNGGSDGSATVSASGGASPYTYAWSPTGGNAATASGLAAGTYTCLVTTSVGCTSTQTVPITQPTAVTATATTTPATCGSNNGSATVVASGGAGGYTYLWSPSGGTAAIATNLVAGSYSCTITDASGCTHVEPVSVNSSGGPSISLASSTDVTCNGASTGAASMNISGGTSPFSYTWSSLPNTTASVSGIPAGSYTCTVTDGNGCVQSASVLITEPTALTVSTASTDVLCNAGNSGSATVTPGGGAGSYTYLWSPSGGTGATENGLSAASYTCVITDANGCTISDVATITEPIAITSGNSQTNVSCNGGNNGSGSVTASGGSGSFTYVWSPSGGNAATANILSAGPYTCIITDANGCSVTESITITEPTAITASSSTVSANCGNNNGSATVTASGGTAPYSYFWPASGTINATDTNLAAGTYTCIFSDNNGCNDSVSVMILNSGTPAVTLGSQTDVSCYGGNNGAVTVTVSGGSPGYSYSWTSGGTAATESNLTAGSYTCTVTDTTGCTQTFSTTITEPATSVQSTSSTIDATCNLQNGSATVVPSGGTPGYTYSWSSGGSSATESNLASGIYTCTITDANGCTMSISDTVNAVGGPTVALQSSTDPLCNGGNDGTATVNVSAGNGPYTYLWSSGGTNATETGLSASQTYTCTVTDVNGCTSTQTVTLSQPPAYSASVSSSSNVSCFSGTNGAATASGTGGTGPYTYSWNSVPVQSNAAATGLAQGSYVCTVTDANGCTTTTSVTITQPASSVSATASPTNGCGVNSASASVTASGGTASYTYAWSPSGGTAATATGLSTGSYTCTITDANGCTTTTVATVTANPNPTVTVTASSSSVQMGGNTTLTAAGGGAYTWTPSTGLSCTTCSTPLATPSLTTVYCATGIDGNGCQDSACTTITVDTDCGEIFVPNAFSPNNDGSNDVISVYGGACLQEMEFVIYDRWGEEVYRSTDPTQTWDGIYKGKELNSGVFVYYLRGTLYNGNPVTVEGNISLIR